MNQLVMHNKVTLLGNVYTMKPSFASISEIEAATNKGFFLLARQFQSGEFVFTDMVDVIFYGIKHGGNQNYPERAEIGEAILRSGIECSVEPVIVFFNLAISGGEK